jgi:hypothetical protein
MAEGEANRPEPPPGVLEGLEEAARKHGLRPFE